MQSKRQQNIEYGKSASTKSSTRRSNARNCNLKVESEEKNCNSKSTNTEKNCNSTSSRTRNCNSTSSKTRNCNSTSSRNYDKKPADGPLKRTTSASKRKVEAGSDCSGRCGKTTGRKTKSSK